MFWSKNKKNRYTPANPSFNIIKKKWGLRGYSLYGHVFLMLWGFNQAEPNTNLTENSLDMFPGDLLTAFNSQNSCYYSWTAYIRVNQEQKYMKFNILLLGGNFLEH